MNGAGMFWIGTLPLLASCAPAYQDGKGQLDEPVRLAQGEKRAEGSIPPVVESAPSTAPAQAAAAPDSRKALLVLETSGDEVGSFSQEIREAR